MQVMNTAGAPSSFALQNFGVTMTFTDKAYMEPEDFLTLLMKAVIFERRTGEIGYPLLEEATWEVMMEY